MATYKVEQNKPDSRMSKTSKFFLSLSLLVLIGGVAYYLIRAHNEAKKYSAEGQVKILEDMQKTNVHSYSPEELDQISQNAPKEDNTTSELSDQQKRDLLEALMHQ